MAPWQALAEGVISDNESRELTQIATILDLPVPEEIACDAAAESSRRVVGYSPAQKLRGNSSAPALLPVRSPRTYADAVPTRVILIDGNRLARLMIRYGVGVQVHETFRAIEIDEDFFA